MNELFELFTEALNRTDPAERAAFLDQACAGKSRSAPPAEGATRQPCQGRQPAGPAAGRAGRAYGDCRPTESDRERRASARLGD